MSKQKRVYRRWNEILVKINKNKATVRSYQIQKKTSLHPRGERPKTNKLPRCLVVGTYGTFARGSWNFKSFKRKT